MMPGTIFLYVFIMLTDLMPLPNRVIGSSVVREFMVDFRNGKAQDTVRFSESSYDSNGNLLKKTLYYNDKILNTSVYLPKNEKSFSAYLTKMDSIEYVSVQNGKELKYRNGKLINKTFYDGRGNVTTAINYDNMGVNHVIGTAKYSYTYNSMRKKSSEIFIWNNKKIYKIIYTYDKDSLLVEADYLYNTCCEANQPIPADRIVYNYNSLKKLSKEISVIDRNVKRVYKSEFNGYYDQATVISYLYDDKLRLLYKRVSTSNISDNPNVDIKNLYVLPEFLSKEFIYVYE